MPTHLAKETDPQDTWNPWFPNSQLTNMDKMIHEINLAQSYRYIKKIMEGPFPTRL